MEGGSAVLTSVCFLLSFETHRFQVIKIWSCSLLQYGKRLLNKYTLSKCTLLNTGEQKEHKEDYTSTDQSLSSPSACHYYVRWWLPREECRNRTTTGSTISASLKHLSSLQ